MASSEALRCGGYDRRYCGELEGSMAVLGYCVKPRLDIINLTGILHFAHRCSRQQICVV